MDNQKDVIKKCIAGNRSAQNELYNYFSPRMMSICLRYSKNRFEAEEILQESFIKVFTHLHQYKYEGSFEGWIKKIVVNCALQKLRATTTLHNAVNIDDVPVKYLEHELINTNIHVKELLALIQGLPNMCRIVFNLYVFEGMKHREIASMLKITEGTSKSTLHDARVMLRVKVSEELSINNENYQQHG